jgi:beta-galactosidase
LLLLYGRPDVVIADFASVKEMLLMLFSMSLCQVEVEIDSHKEDWEHVSTLSIEAILYDNSGPSDVFNAGHLSAVAVNLKPKTKSVSRCFGFHGYVLGGKIENPKLWSSEHVRGPTSWKFYCETHITIQLHNTMTF